MPCTGAHRDLTFHSRYPTYDPSDKRVDIALLELESVGRF